MSRRFVIVTFACACLVYSWSLVSAARVQHDAKAHRHQEAQSLVNPVKSSPEVLARGRKLYDRYCVDCHGEEGKGDGIGGETLKPPPANLTDDVWQHGSSDGEIFVVIRDGSGENMKSFKKQITEPQLWELVTFLKSFQKKP